MTQYAGFGAPVGAPVCSSIGPTAGRSRLTRRGRLLVVLLSAGLLLAAFSLGRADSQAAVAPSTGGAVLEQTVVMPGDTLWSIARDIAPDNDPREVIAQIRELNDLSGGLIAGQQLLLPTAA